MKLLNPAALSQVRCEYWVPTGSEAGDVLIVAFRGVYRSGSLGNADADYMRGQVVAGLAMYRPMGPLLDFRELECEWGKLAPRRLPRRRRIPESWEREAVSGPHSCFG